MHVTERKLRQLFADQGYHVREIRAGKHWVARVERDDGAGLQFNVTVARSPSDPSNTTERFLTMTKVSLEAMLRRASRQAEKMFDEQGSISMFWLAETADGEQFTIVTPVDGPPEVSNNELKNTIAAKVRGLFRKHDVRRYAQVCEGWQGKDNSCLPSEHPERREVVFITAADEHEHLFAIRDLVRPPNGKPYLAKLGEIDRPKRLKSRFLDMLPRAGRLRFSNELDDNEGRVFLTDVPGASIRVIGRRDPDTGDLCFTGTYDVNEETTKKFAALPAWVEVVTGPEAEQLVAAVSKLLRAEKSS